MSVRLEDTSGGAIAAEIGRERRRLGAATSGMVLTLLVLADEEAQADALAAAVSAARSHPMRIIGLIPRPDTKTTRLDAEITVGGDSGGGEVAVLRLRGLLSEHANSVAVPLLLPDTPVVAYWPDDAPAVPADSPIGRHAQRRITDAATARDPIGMLAVRRDGYQDGDTDLAWTRLTPWRSVLATMFDAAPLAVSGGTVHAEEGNPSAVLLATWLRTCLGCPVDVDWGTGPGITAVRLETPDGTYAIERPDGAVAMMRRPGAPDATVALPRRDLAQLLAEELRRLDPDDTYAQAIAAIG